MLFIFKSLHASLLVPFPFPLFYFISHFLLSPILSLLLAKPSFSLLGNRESTCTVLSLTSKVPTPFFNELVKREERARFDSFDRSLLFANLPSCCLMQVLTWLPMPRMNSMTKNNTAQRLGNGIRATASGYAMKARPAPLLITSSIGMPIWRARNPIMEKITNPAKIDVARFVNVTIIASLREVKEKNIFKTGSRMFAFSLVRIRQVLSHFYIFMHSDNLSYPPWLLRDQDHLLFVSTSRFRRTFESCMNISQTTDHKSSYQTHQCGRKWVDGVVFYLRIVTRIRRSDSASDAI